MNGAVLKGAKMNGAKLCSAIGMVLFFVSLASALPTVNSSFNPDPLLNGLSADLRCTGTSADSTLGYDYKAYVNDSLVYFGSEFKAGSLSMYGTTACAIRESDGRVMCWGFDDYGQIGIGGDYVSESPKYVGNGYDSVSVTVSNGCGIRSSDNRVMCWGKSGDILGYSGSGRHTFEPTLISETSSFSSVSAKSYHSCGIRSSDSRVMCWGMGTYGRLGNGGTSSTNTATLINDTSAYSLIVAGELHSCGIRQNDSRVLCWGYNYRGQLGTGDTMQRENPTLISGTTAFSKVDVHGQTSCGIRSSDGRVMCWGSNIVGALGIGNTTHMSVPVLTNDTSAYTDIAVSQSSAVCGIRQNDSRVLCWGSGSLGRGGDGDTANSYVPKLTNDTSAYSKISAGFGYFCGILSSDGRVKCWGPNANAVLGNGDTTYRTIPTYINSSLSFVDLDLSQMTSCGITNTGDRYCWGLFSYGHFGDGENAYVVTPTLTTDDSSYKKVDVGSNFACGLKVDGNLTCWGFQGNGAFGIGSTTAQNVPIDAFSGYTFSDFSSGYSQVCGINDSNGRLICSGSNSYGALPINDTGSYFTSPQVSSDDSNYAFVDMGYYNGCGLLGDGQAKCWGYNSNGVLGDGTTNDRRIPDYVDGNHSFSDIFVTDYVACGIRLNDSRVLCWGKNYYGVIGVGDTNTNNYYLEPTLISDSSKYSFIEGSGYSVCGVHEADNLGYCWGWNMNGNLGDSTISTRYSPTAISGGYEFREVELGGTSSCGIRLNDSRLLCWGLAEHGLLNYDLTSTVFSTTNDIRYPRLTVNSTDFFQNTTNVDDVWKIMNSIPAENVTEGDNWTLSCRSLDSTGFSSWYNVSRVVQALTCPDVTSGGIKGFILENGTASCMKVDQDGDVRVVGSAYFNQGPLVPPADVFKVMDSGGNAFFYVDSSCNLYASGSLTQSASVTYSGVGSLYVYDDGSSSYVFKVDDSGNIYTKGSFGFNCAL